MSMYKTPGLKANLRERAGNSTMPEQEILVL